jgi:hypothetical protein
MDAFSHDEFFISVIAVTVLRDPHQQYISEIAVSQFPASHIAP